MNAIIPDDTSKFDCNSNNNEKTLEGKVVTSESRRRGSLHSRKSVYGTRSKASIKEFKVDF